MYVLYVHMYMYMYMYFLSLSPLTTITHTSSKLLKDPGKLKIQPDGFYFKSTKSGKAFHVSDGDLDVIEWMRVARGHEVKIFTVDGNVTKFAGFKESVSCCVCTCMWHLHHSSTEHAC